MFEIVHALKQWRPYVMGRYFKVKIDHDSPNFFWNKKYLQKSRKNGSQRFWVISLKSSTKGEAKFCCRCTLKKK